MLKTRAPVRVVAAVVLVTLAAAAWAEPFGFSVNSRGDFNDDQMVNALWRVNLATGESEYIGWTGFLDVEGLAFRSDGALFGADDESNTLLRIRLSDGFGIPVGSSQHNMGIPIDQRMDFGLTFTCSADLLAVSAARHSLYQVDVETGLLSLIGSEGSLGVPITDIAERGGVLYGIGRGLDGDGNPDAPNLYRIDPDQATSELIGALGAAVSPYNQAGLSFDEQGGLWAITDRRDVGGQDFNSEILKIDPATGAAEMIAESSIVGQESLAIAPPAGCEGDPGEAPPAFGDGAVKIPVMQGFGLSLLVLLLAAAGGWHLRTGRS